jgi:hypothetical protein
MGRVQFAFASTFASQALVLQAACTPSRFFDPLALHFQAVGPDHTTDDLPALDRLGEVEVIAVPRERRPAQIEEEVQPAIDLRPPATSLLRRITDDRAR